MFYISLHDTRYRHYQGIEYDKYQYVRRNLSFISDEMFHIQSLRLIHILWKSCDCKITNGDINMFLDVYNGFDVMYVMNVLDTFVSEKMSVIVMDLEKNFMIFLKSVDDVTKIHWGFHNDTFILTDSSLHIKNTSHYSEVWKKKKLIMLLSLPTIIHNY